MDYCVVVLKELYVIIFYTIGGKGIPALNIQPIIG